MKRSYLRRFLESCPEVAAKLRESNSKLPSFGATRATVQRETVLVQAHH